MLSSHPPALLAIDYPTRLLRLCLGVLSPLLEPRPLPVSGPITNGGGKRAKKRAREGEDGLVGGLEGRESTMFGAGEIQLMVESLKCAWASLPPDLADMDTVTPLLHRTPLLSPELLTLSLRLHISVHLTLPSLPTLSKDSAMIDAIAHVLEEALLINESSSGTSPGWKSVILSVLVGVTPRSTPFSAYSK